MDAIAVFDKNGKFIRSFGKEFHGGGHGLAIRKEGKKNSSTSATSRTARSPRCRFAAKSSGAAAPEEAGVYNQGAAYVPTNVAFAPDGGFYVGDGYGSSYLHQYNRDAQWVRTWGGQGKDAGKLNCPHGLWWDDRPGRTPSLVVADRANARLQVYVRRQAPFVYPWAAASLLLQHSRRRAAGARPARPRFAAGRGQLLRSCIWGMRKPGRSGCCGRGSATSRNNGNRAGSFTRPGGFDSARQHLRRRMGADRPDASAARGVSNNKVSSAGEGRIGNSFARRSSAFFNNPKAFAHFSHASVILLMLPAISAEIGFAQVIAVKAQTINCFAHATCTLTSCH